MFGGEGGERYIVERRARVGLQHPQVLQSLLAHLVDVLGGVFVFGWLHAEVQLAVGLVGLVEAVCFGDVAVQILPHR